MNKKSPESAHDNKINDTIDTTSEHKKDDEFDNELEIPGSELSEDPPDEPADSDTDH